MEHSECWKKLKREKRRRRIVYILVITITLLILAPFIGAPTFGANKDIKILPAQFEKNIKCSFQFTKSEKEYLEENCNFTDEELDIFRLRCAGKTNLQVSFIMEEKYGNENPTHQYSLRKVERKVRKIKNKILKVI